MGVAVARSAFAAVRKTSTAPALWLMLRMRTRACPAAGAVPLSSVVTKPVTGPPPVPPVANTV
jgi:hypothetical protein